MIYESFFNLGTEIVVPKILISVPASATDWSVNIDRRFMNNEDCVSSTNLYSIFTNPELELRISGGDQYDYDLTKDKIPAFRDHSSSKDIQGIWITHLIPRRATFNFSAELLESATGLVSISIHETCDLLIPELMQDYSDTTDAGAVSIGYNNEASDQDKPVYILCNFSRNSGTL